MSTGKIMYRVAWGRIEPFTVQRETLKMVWYVTEKGLLRPEHKVGFNQNWFNTWEMAHNHLTSTIESQPVIARGRIEHLTRELESRKAMKPAVPGFTRSLLKDGA